MEIKAEEMLKLIEELDDEMKQEVLDKFIYGYFEGGGARRHIVKEKN